MFQTEVVEKLKTLILRSVTFYRKSCRLWDNIVQPGRPQMTIWRMRIASWITTATDKHSEHVIFFLKRLIYCCEMYEYLHEFSIKTVPDTSLFETSDLI